MAIISEHPATEPTSSNAQLGRKQREQFSETLGWIQEQEVEEEDSC